MSNRKLVEHIEAINAQNGSDFEITTRLEHWADYDIYTPEEFDRYMLEQEYIGLYKEMYGVKPRDFADKSDADMQLQIDKMVDALDAIFEDQREFEETDEMLDFTLDIFEEDEPTEWEEIEAEMDIKFNVTLH